MKKFTALILSAVMLLSAGCTKEETDLKQTAETTAASVAEENVLESLSGGVAINKVSENLYKTADMANPLSSDIYCADPTGVEYNGRLYVYGTNDNQQFEVKGKGSGGGYEYIKSLVIFSTDDMVNWVYHGIINVGEIAPWIYNSWAPSIISRVEDDGLTHFYLYFSNSGAGVGVITSTDPVVGWSDPLGGPLVYQDMPGLENCPAPFDPGAVIDENGIGWLAFGGGAPNGDGVMHTSIPKIARLGDDLISFDSEFVSIDAPYFFEASELNYIDGVYYYTYCNDWQNHSLGWKDDYGDIPAPPACSMSYMTTTTPLVSESWEYKGAYFYNAGENAKGGSGMRWSNNHTHFLEYEGTNYILHHTMLLEELNGSDDGFRSLMVDYLPINSDGTIPITAATYKGVAQIKPLDPYAENPGSVMFTSADIGFGDSETDPASKSLGEGAYICVKNCDFGYGASEFRASVKGEGRLEVRLDSADSAPVSFIEFNNEDFAWVKSAGFESFGGRLHDVYLVFSGEGIELGAWKFIKGEEELRPEEEIETDGSDEDIDIDELLGNKVDTESMQLAFEWTAPEKNTVNAAWLGTESFLSAEQNQKLLEALNTEGAYVELEGFNTCSQNHGAVVQFCFNGGETFNFYNLGPLSGEFEGGVAVADVLSAGGQELPINSMLFQFFIWEHDKMHTTDGTLDSDFAENDLYYLNALRVYIPQ